MKRTPRPVTWPCLAALSLLVAPTAMAQQSKPAKAKEAVPPFGIQFFSGLLHRQGLQPIQTFDDLARRDPKQTAIIIFGDPAALGPVRSRIGDLRKFQLQGGAVLIATERKTVLKEFGAVVKGNVIRESKENSYLGIKKCPLVTNLFEPGHPLLKGVTRLITNEPSEIRLQPGAGLRPLADYWLFEPFGSSPDTTRCFLAVGGGRGETEGRVLVAAGHSVFMNLLMVPGDADNRAFAVNCVKWLAEGERKHCLLVEEGTIRTSFDVPLKQPVPIPLPGVEKINLFLAALEDANAFNKFVLGKEGERKPRILQFLFLIASILVLFRLATRVFGGRHTRESGLALTARTLELTTSDRPLLRQRRDVLARAGNLAEVAADVARRWLESHGLGQMGARPRAEARRGAAVRGWQKQLDELWQLARGPARRAVSVRQFRALLGTMERASAAVRAGALRLKSS